MIITLSYVSVMAAYTAHCNFCFVKIPPDPWLKDVLTREDGRVEVYKVPRDGHKNHTIQRLQSAQQSS
jgi:hypothetical protein